MLINPIISRLSQIDSINGVNVTFDLNISQNALAFSKSNSGQSNSVNVIVEINKLNSTASVVVYQLPLVENSQMIATQSIDIDITDWNKSANNVLYWIESNIHLVNREFK